MDYLVEALSLITYKTVIMWIIGGVLIFLAIKYKMEPALLLPMGFGAILVNIPLTNVISSEGEVGIISWLYEIGIGASEALPIRKKAWKTKPRKKINRIRANDKKRDRLIKVGRCDFR